MCQLGMKRKKKWAVEGQIKRTNWKAVPASKLTEKVITTRKSRLHISSQAFWTGVDEERLASQALIEVSSYLLSHGSFLMASASWLLPHGSYLLPPASWLLPPDSRLLTPDY